MTTRNDTRPAIDNSGGVPTEAALIEYLNNVERPVSLDQLANATEATPEQLKTRVESLKKRGLIVISIGLYHVTVRLVDNVQPVADGGKVEERVSVDYMIDLTPSEVYTVLSNERRRRTIRILARQLRQNGDEETYASVSPLAAVLCASQEGFSSATTTNDQHSMYVTLTQTHLPLLHDLGAVEYYSRVQKVQPTDATLALDQLMDVVDDVASEEADE